MAGAIPTLLALTRQLANAKTLQETLQPVVERCVELLETPRVSLRLLDPTRSRLIATCRAGKPLHQNPTSPWRLNEGLIGWIAAQLQPLRANDAEADPRFVARADMVDRMGSFMGAPVVHEGQCIGVISAVHPEKGAFTDEHEQLLMLVAGICAPHLEVARLSRLAQVDALTGAFNRRGLEVAFPEDASQRLLSIAMLDLDHFKRVNDELGHPAGDECLRRVAQLVAGVLRAEDAVVRYGGEEFLLVLPGIDASHAARIAERVRAAAEGTVFRLEGKERKVTLSAGVAQRLPDEKRDQTIARADQALYLAKQEGRNRVAVAG
ncbi:MAG: sensor domain-containing diguanylate cyclase [Myxococcales bacterium]|nr:sensor domain-containing diguanylate cyclase [Myxococcales bacterium]